MTTGSIHEPAPLVDTPQQGKSTLAEDPSEVALEESAEVNETPGGTGSRQRREIDAEQLVGFGELGLLPSLLQSLGPVGQCDFDDAFSTCQ